MQLEKQLEKHFSANSPFGTPFSVDSRNTNDVDNVDNSNDYVESQLSECHINTTSQETDQDNMSACDLSVNQEYQKNYNWQRLSVNGSKECSNLNDSLLCSQTDGNTVISADDLGHRECNTTTKTLSDSDQDNDMEQEQNGEVPFSSLNNYSKEVSDTINNNTSISNGNSKINDNGCAMPKYEDISDDEDGIQGSQSQPCSPFVHSPSPYNRIFASPKGKYLYMYYA